MTFWNFDMENFYHSLVDDVAILCGLDSIHSQKLSLFPTFTFDTPTINGKYEHNSSNSQKECISLSLKLTDYPLPKGNQPNSRQITIVKDTITNCRHKPNELSCKIQIQNMIDSNNSKVLSLNNIISIVDACHGPENTELSYHEDNGENENQLNLFIDTELTQNSECDFQSKFNSGDFTGDKMLTYFDDELSMDVSVLQAPDFNLEFDDDISRSKVSSPTNMSFRSDEFHLEQVDDEIDNQSWNWLMDMP